MCPVMAVCFAVALQLQSLRIHLNQNRSVCVRAHGLRTVAGIALLDSRVRMVEAVAITGSEYDVVWCDGSNEIFGRGTFAAVVRRDQQGGGKLVSMQLQQTRFG